MRRDRPAIPKVFGSRARGDADPDSDLDVVVIVPIVYSRTEWETGPEEKPSRPLRDYIAKRERRESGSLKAAR
ncbi:MAG: nucleotidyltransferase domain-containing protein [Candidatus Bipolaricaulota bacterium]|nr:nucleotidyltransferase domain-containing protein [Candidatus Bipolaricaulota bacterium]